MTPSDPEKAAAAKAEAAAEKAAKEAEAAKTSSGTVNMASASTGEDGGATSTDNSTKNSAESACNESSSIDTNPCPEELKVAVKEILGDQWEVHFEKKSDTFRITKSAALEPEVDELIKVHSTPSLTPSVVSNVSDVACA